MNYPEGKLAEIHLAVKNRDLDFVRTFLASSRHPGITRRTMYAACLFDDVEVAEMCMKAGWVYDHYAILTALHEGATKVADFLYEKARDKDLNKHLKYGVFVCTWINARASSVNCATARWLIARGYTVGYSELRSLAICDEFDQFKVIFDLTCASFCMSHCEEMFNDCIQTGAFRVAEFFECVKGMKICNVVLPDWDDGARLEAYKAKRAEREHAAIVIQMEWQNYRRRKDPSIALKEAAESWNKLVSEFPEKFV